MDAVILEAEGVSDEAKVLIYRELHAAITQKNRLAKKARDAENAPR